jgi:hypothetical protein
MSVKDCVLLAAVFALLLGVATISEAQKMNDDLSLSAKQQRIIPIAAFTATGAMEKLRTALHAGLEAGLTVAVEINGWFVRAHARDIITSTAALGGRGEGFAPPGTNTEGRQ